MVGCVNKLITVSYGHRPPHERVRMGSYFISNLGHVYVRVKNKNEYRIHKY